MTERSVPMPESSPPTLFGEALNLYVGNWGSQLLIYGVTFCTALFVAFVADVRLGMPPERVMLLVTLLIVVLMITIPLGWAQYSILPKYRYATALYYYVTTDAMVRLQNDIAHSKDVREAEALLGEVLTLNEQQRIFSNKEVLEIVLRLVIHLRLTKVNSPTTDNEEGSEYDPVMRYFVGSLLRLIESGRGFNFVTKSDALLTRIRT